jgi:hypothetical protein
MGNTYSIKIHYPYELNIVNNINKRISTLTSNYHNNIKNNMISSNYQLILLLCADNFHLDNYNELASRLIANKKIVIIINNNCHTNINNNNNNNNNKIRTDHSNFKLLLFNLIKHLKHQLVVMYNINLIIDHITLIGHHSSCNDLIYLNYRHVIKHNHIILIDPIFKIETIQYIFYISKLILSKSESLSASVSNSNYNHIKIDLQPQQFQQIPQNNNIMSNVSIILSNDFINLSNDNDNNEYHSILNILSNKIFLLPNVNSSDIENSLTMKTNYSDIEKNLSSWDSVANTILSMEIK